MTKITEYTLDVSKWRCGGIGFGPNVLGEGGTKMLNDEGYMCCLGQFAEQAGIDKSILNRKSFPASVARSVESIYDSTFVHFERTAMGGYEDTKLADALSSINDNPNTTPTEKIELIRNKLSQRGIKLNVIDPNNQLEALE